jgi:hypothetical protein
MNLGEMLSKIDSCFQDIEEYIDDSDFSTEKLFLINPKEKAFRDFVRDNKNNFTIIIKRTE